MKKKIKFHGPGLKWKTYSIIREAVERGIRYGYNRSFKHTDKPEEELINETISDAVMSEFDEIFYFPEEYK